MALKKLQKTYMSYSGYYKHTLAGLPPNGLHPLFCEYYYRTTKMNKP